MYARTDHERGPGTRVRAPRAVTLRPYRPSDRGAVAAMSEDLSPRSLYRRFFSGCPQLPSAFLDRLDRGRDEPGIVLLAVHDTVVLGVGELIVTGARPDQAELGLLVRDSHHRQGLGLRLAQSLVDHASRCAVAVVVAEVLADNRAMRSMMQTHYPSASAVMSGTTVRYELGL